MRVVRWAVERGVRDVVLISGAIVYGKWSDAPKTEEDEVAPWIAGPYAVSKWCSEQVAGLLRATTCELTVLRLGSLYGAGYGGGLAQRFLASGRAEGRIALAAPFDDSFGLLHVADAARTIAASVAAGGLWNVGGGLVSIRELAAACAAAVSADLELDKVGVPARPGRILNWVDDRRARDALGHANEVSLKAGVAEIAGIDE